MATCPNKNTEAWQLLVSSRGEDVAHYLWDKYDGNVPESESNEAIVKSGLKATNILQSPKADQFFNAVAKNKITGDFFWKKMQADLGIPKEQIELLKQYNTTDRNELITNILADYSYAIEINIAEQTNKEFGESQGYDEQELTERGIDINRTYPTQYYSNLTVPGGTNYTENEIATPAITPNIKGHAQFATDQGIGWFRSDEKPKYTHFEAYNGGNEFEYEGNKYEEVEDIHMMALPTYTKNGKEISEKEYNEVFNKAREAKTTDYKTRRILEVQSDLFQKGRDKKVLSGEEDQIGADIDEAIEAIEERVKEGSFTREYADNEISKLKSEQNSKQNQFLQLLNQGSNWVTFFVKSIIQDSAKKGYEKVLFPSGNTASKVEGHTTLEEFKKQKEDRIKELEKTQVKYFGEQITSDYEPTGNITNWYSTKEEAEEAAKKEYENYQIGQTDGFDNSKEIEQLKQELARVEGPEGFGALKPIYNFYENTVKNVLNKQYGKENVKQITDEYGNTWNEINIIPEREQQQILFQLPKEGQKVASPQLIKLMKEFIKQIGVDYKLVENIVINGKKQDANGVALIMQKLIQVVEGQEDVALPEEAMHFAVEIIKQTNPKLYQQLLKEINGHPKLNEVIALYGNHPLYQKDGRRDIVKLKEEAIAQVLVDRMEDAVGRTWWQKILDWLTPRFLQSGFSKASMDVLSGRLASVDNIDVSKGSAYLQISEGERVFNSIKETSEQITTDEGKYVFNGEKIKNRVSDRVKEFYERLFGTDLNEDEFVKAVNDLKAEKGTEKHAALEYAQSIYVDPETGLLREEPLDDSDYVNSLNNIDRDIYIALRNNLRDRLNSFPPGTRFMSEVKIIDPKRSVAGTIDFLAITPEGKVNILDWKFMDLNTERYEDVPWYKVQAWNMQMKDYKSILISNYNIKNQDFQQTRMIPILAIYTQADYEKEILPQLRSIKIGDANVQNITEDYLLPVGITQEKTGNKRIDTLIEKLNNTYKKLSEQKVSDTEKANKAEQLNALYKAIRHLQIKGNIVPLINQAKILNKQVSMLMDKYKSDFEGKEKEDIPQDKINAFAGLIRIHLEALAPYLDLKLLRSSISNETEEGLKLKSEINDTLEIVENYIADLQDLDETFGEKFNETSSTPEKVVKGISKWFSNMATLQVANIQSLYKKANRAFFLAEQETLDEVKRLSTLKENYEKWASSKGLSVKNYFDILMKKDKNELIDEFDKKFYDELKTRIAKKDHAWIIENIDEQAYRDYIEDKIEEETKRILALPRVGTIEEAKAQVKKELAKLYNKYSLENRKSNGWLSYTDVRQFPKREKWESAEWKELNKPENAPAREFYNYIIERNKYYQEIGYLQGKAARKFLPWIRKGFIEGLAFDGATRGMGEQFLRNISMDEAEAGYGQTDPTTGELINVVPRYFTKDFGEGYSTDLFKTMALYNQYAIKFKNLKDIEESALQLLRIERNKKSIMTSRFGRLVKEGDDFKYVDNSENSQLLEDMIKAVIYQQKYIESEVFDVYLGKISGFGKKINDKLGMKIFPEDLEERQLSANKLIDTINTQFQLTTLGLNSLSAISNLFGGTANGLINAGKYFTKLDYAKTQMWMFANKMQGTVLGKSSLGDDPRKAIAALDYFLPFVESYNRDAAKKLSLNKFDEQQLQDFLMYFMRTGERAVQTLNFYAFLKNAVVIDNKIVNVREYLRTTDEYKNFYAGTQAERKARKDKFDKDAEALIDEKGVLKLGEIKDGEFVIPGVDKKSDSVMEFRRLVQSFTSDALGSMSEENKRKVNMNVYSSSTMVFKNWIPRLVDVRIGNMKYNAASDAYEWGRMRMIFGMLTTDIMKSIKSTKAALAGDGDVWLAQVRELYEKKRKEYKDKTNKDLDMTEDEFISLVNQNIKNQVTDLVILLSLMSLLAGLKAAAPDDDEEPIVKNQWKFYVKATDKLTDELMYFYKPTTPFDLISAKGGIVPSLGLLENYVKFTKQFALENFGMIVGDEEIQDDAKPIKYLMKSFPISNQAAGYLPMFYPEIAKDLGIKMQGQYGIR
jgi:hypothetical protein